jgi:Tol biopolymer transport system component
MNKRLLLTYCLLIPATLHLLGCFPQEAPTEPFQKGGQAIGAGYYPIISPNGLNIAYSRDSVIYIADENGSNEIAIYKGAYAYQSLRWSPDNDKIGFVEFDPVQLMFNKIVIVDVRTRIKTPLISSLPLGAIDWSWNSAGTQIACWTYDNITDMNILTIVSSDGNGTVIKKFAASQYSWSPDGSKVAYLTPQKNYADTVHLYIASINPDTSQLFASYSGVSLSLQWSPNQNIIGVSQGYGSLVLFDIYRHVAVDTLYMGGFGSYAQSFSFSPDGRTIAYTYVPSNYFSPDEVVYSYLDVLDIASNVSAPLVTSFPGLDSYNWFPSSQEILYEFNGNLYTAKVN